MSKNEHFYAFDPFKVRTYLYHRQSKDTDYKKILYFPKHYELSKKN